jgi:hypothetical protein
VFVQLEPEAVKAVKRLQDPTKLSRLTKALASGTKFGYDPSEALTTLISKRLIEDIRKDP